MILQMKEGVIMDERIIELAAFYQAMGYPLYDEEHLKEMNRHYMKRHFQIGMNKEISYELSWSNI